MWNSFSEIALQLRNLPFFWHGCRSGLINTFEATYKLLRWVHDRAAKDHGIRASCNSGATRLWDGRATKRLTLTPPSMKAGRMVKMLSDPTSYALIGWTQEGALISLAAIEFFGPRFTVPFPYIPAVVKE